MRRWDIQFYFVLIAVSVFILTGLTLTKTDYAISAFLGAVIVSINFAVLILLGKYFFNTPKRRTVPIILLIAHIFIAPASLYLVIRFININIVSLLVGTLISATVSPLAMAIIGILHARSQDTFSHVAVRNGNGEEER